MPTLYRCLRCGIHHHMTCPVCFCSEHQVVKDLDLAPLGIVGTAKVRVGNKHHTLIIDLDSCTKKITLQQGDLVPHSK